MCLPCCIAKSTLTFMLFISINFSICTEYRCKLFWKSVPHTKCQDDFPVLGFCRVMLNESGEMGAARLFVHNVKMARGLQKRNETRCNSSGHRCKWQAVTPSSPHSF